MFTGIVQTQGQVLSLEKGDNFVQIRLITDSYMADKLTLGASIANNGVCLTVVDYKTLEDNRAQLTFDVIDETLKLTNLKQLESGTWVNLERSMKVGDEIGGHQVSGHIQTEATLIERLDSTNNCQLTYEVDSKWSPYLFEKGFIAVNGASLTLGKVDGGKFNLHLIPETLERTNIGQMKVGETANIEFDQQTVTIVQTIERLAESGKLTGFRLEKNN
jgi:riboflavin synthase